MAKALIVDRRLLVHYTPATGESKLVTKDGTDDCPTCDCICNCPVSADAATNVSVPPFLSLFTNCINGGIPCEPNTVGLRLKGISYGYSPGQVLYIGWNVVFGHMWIRFKSFPPTDLRACLNFLGGEPL